MLERMFFDVTRGGVHSQVDVTVKDGLVYHKARLFNSMPDLSVKPNEPYPASTEWLMRLARLNLSGLDRHYRSEQPEDNRPEQIVSGKRRLAPGCGGTAGADARKSADQ